MIASISLFVMDHISIMIVVMGIGTNKQEDLDSDYNQYIYLDDNNTINKNNVFRVKSYEYDYQDNNIYENFINILNETNKKYNKFNNNKDDTLEYKYTESNQSKPIPIPKSNYL